MFQVSENAMLFAAYGVCQKGVSYIVNKDVSNLSAFHNALAGSFAAFFSSLTLCPTELIKCRLQTMEQVKMSSGPSNFTVTSTNKKMFVSITQLPTLTTEREKFKICSFQLLSFFFIQ